MFSPGPPRDERELPARFSFGEIKVDVAAVQVLRAGESVSVEPKAFDLLLLLAANPSRVVEKAEIFERLWGVTFVTDNALTRVVASLRRSLGDRADNSTYIETVRTRGYRFLPEIEPFEPGPPGVNEPPARSPARAGKQRVLLWTIVLTMVIVGALGVAWFTRRTTVSHPSHDAWLSPIQLSTEPGDYYYPDFSPDGSQIAYVTKAGRSLQLYIQPVNGGQPVRLTRTGVCAEPSWSPDGRWIVYTDFTRGGLWLVSPTGGTKRKLTEFGTQPAWSPDSRTVVFSNPGSPVLGALQWPTPPGSTLWTVNVDDGAVRQLAPELPESGGEGEPAFTPDGRWVVFATQNFSSSKLWRVSAEGGTPDVLLSTAKLTGNWLISWHDPTPDPLRNALYFIHRTPEFTRIDRLWLDGSGRLEPLLAPAPAGAAQLAISKDGRRLAFAVQQSRTSIEELTLDGGGHSSGEPRTLAAPPIERVALPLYSPDGRFMFYRRLRAGSAPEGVIIDASGRTLQVVRGVPTWLSLWISPTEVLLDPLEKSVRVDALTGRKVPFPLLPHAASILERAGEQRVNIAPDLRSVTFTGAVDSSRELFVWDSDKPAPRQLTHLGGMIAFPNFSRDGKWVLFQFTRGRTMANAVYRVPRDGGKPELILTGKGPSWPGTASTYSGLVAYSAERGGAWYLAVAGTKVPERILDVDPEVPGYLRWPTWSADGTRLAYERTQYSSKLWMLDLQHSAKHD
jgi:Tol biopolymer transport system component/DNA-binding winged helix-turn-helix (wHTH) protein